MSQGFLNLRQYLAELERSRSLVVVEAEVNPELELPEIHRRIVASGGPALLFRRVTGSRFPVVTNLFGTRERVDVAFGRSHPELMAGIARLAERAPSLATLWEGRHSLLRAARIGTRRSLRTPPVLRRRLDDPRGILALPALRQWPLDGGPFLTLPLVYTEHPETRVANLGMYRIQFHAPRLAGMHWQIHRGGGFHYHRSEALGKPLPTTVFLGGPPLLTLAAIAPLPENIPEVLFASFLLGRKIPVGKLRGFPHPLFGEAEFAITGQVPPRKRHPEGPFGDHYGYYSLRHDFPVLEVENVFHRPDAIFPATVVGRPRQEDFFIGEYIQDLFVPLLKMLIPGLVDLRSFGETGFHALAAARVRNRYHKEAMTTTFRILGEGQLSLQKVLMVTDSGPELGDFRRLLPHFLARTDWSADFHVISNVSQDTLDYTGPRLNEGSKAIWLALGDARFPLAESIPTELPQGVTRAALFVPGCLVVEGPGHSSEPEFAARLAGHDALSQFRMVVVVDSLSQALASTSEFLWHWFTRFEPAADVHARINVHRMHVGFAAPAIFDSRMKATYPAVVEPDPETVRRVDARWKEIFPGAGIRT